MVKKLAASPQRVSRLRERISLGHLNKIRPRKISKPCKVRGPQPVFDKDCDPLD